MGDCLHLEGQYDGLPSGSLVLLGLHAIVVGVCYLCRRKVFGTEEIATLSGIHKGDFSRNAIRHNVGEHICIGKPRLIDVEEHIGMSNTAKYVIWHRHISLPHYCSKCFHILKQVFAYFGDILRRIEHHEVHACQSLVGKCTTFHLCLCEIKMLKLCELAYCGNIISIDISFHGHCGYARRTTPLVGIHQTSSLGHVGSRAIIIGGHFEG